MLPIMKSFLIPYLTLGVAFAYLLTCPPVWSQPARSTAISSSISQPEEPPEETFDLDFSGGNPEALLNALESIMSERPNVVVAPQVKDVELPAMNLRSVALHDVFNALNTILQSRGREARFVQPRGSRVWILVGPAEREQAASDQARSSFQARLAAAQKKSQSEDNRQPDLATRVYSLGQYLETYSIADITTAIETAWGLVPQETASEFKFHKDTQLLIVRGTKTQLDILENVLRELTTGIRFEASKDAKQVREPSGSQSSPVTKGQSDNGKE